MLLEVYVFCALTLFCLFFVGRYWVWWPLWHCFVVCGTTNAMPSRSNNATVSLKALDPGNSRPLSALLNQQKGTQSVIIAHGNRRCKITMETDALAAGSA